MYVYMVRDTCSNKSTAIEKSWNFMISPRLCIYIIISLHLLGMSVYQNQRFQLVVEEDSNLKIIKGDLNNNTYFLQFVIIWQRF